MIRIIFVAIVFIHGLIHLMGFINQWHIKQIDQFSGVTLFPVSENLSKILGLIWLLAAILFVLSAVGFLIDKDWWWIAGLASIIVSQILVLVYWKDAKAGTIANGIIAVGIFIPSLIS